MKARDLDYKNNNGSTGDSGTSFSLSAGGPASLLVTGGDPYQVTNGAPTAHNNSVIVGPYTVTVTAFDWYANGVLNLDFVSSENNLAPGGGLDNFGRITFLVQLPEPSTFLMAGLGAVGLVAIVRRRKPAGC